MRSGCHCTPIGNADQGPLHGQRQEALGLLVAHLKPDQARQNDGGGDDPMTTIHGEKFPNLPTMGSLRKKSFEDAQDLWSAPRRISASIAGYSTWKPTQAMAKRTSRLEELFPNAPCASPLPPRPAMPFPLLPGDVKLPGAIRSPIPPVQDAPRPTSPSSQSTPSAQWPSRPSCSRSRDPPPPTGSPSTSSPTSIPARTPSASGP